VIKAGIKNMLVSIGPDEDAHLRIGRELAENMGYTKPATIHARFMPDLSLNKISKSRPADVIPLDEPEASIRKKVQIFFSVDRATLEEHRRLGGDPDSDISVVYLSSYFLPYDQG
jgi:tryptophanyl-tRNA synthetase